jgi:hypothetical protein
MVFIIKSQSGLENDHSMISKMMINIEYNRHLYNKKGERNNDIDSKIPFNDYKHQNVKFNADVSFGMLLIYTNDYDNFSEFSNNIINQFDTELYFPETDLPVNVKKYTNTKYTMMTHRKPTTSYNRFIANNLYNLKNIISQGYRFIWVIQFITRSNSKKYLNIPELCENNFSSQYLSRSLATIIYDDNNMFNITNITKQIDYPYVYQYNMHKHNQLLGEMLYFSNDSGFDYEILKCYSRETVYTPIKLEYTENNEVYKYLVKDYETFNFQKRVLSKKWNDQLFEKNNVTDFKENAQVCFISNTPLYNKGIVLELIEFTSPDDIKNATMETVNNIYIVINPYMYNVIINTLYNNIIENSNDKRKIKILNKYIVYIDRSENDAINMIPDNLIDPLKKEILHAISLNGAINYYDNEVDQIITFDLEKNKIYLGIHKFMDDRFILEYKNTNTTLFSFVTM